MIGTGDQYLVEMQVNGYEYPLTDGRLQQFRIHEWANNLAPMAEVELEDRLNLLTEVAPLTGTETILLKIGDGKTNIVTHTFRIVKIVAAQTGSDSHGIKLTLISSWAYGLLTPARFKSYKEKNLSTIVASIASELKIPRTTIEDTLGTYDVFCPGWTYGRFLSWLSNRARSDKYRTAGFMYFLDLNESLHFHSPDWVKKSTTAIDVIRLDPNNPEAYKEKDVQEGPYRVFYNPALLAAQGAIGVTAAYFDFESSKFIEEPITVDGSVGPDNTPETIGFSTYERSAVRGTQLKDTADKLVLLKAEVDPENFIIRSSGGAFASDAEFSTSTVEAQLLRTLNSGLKMELLIPGDLRVGAGDLISVQIGSPIPQTKQNQTYSGSWVVERVTHQLVPTYVTKLTMFRAGVGGIDASRGTKFVSPPGGKV